MALMAGVSRSPIDPTIGPGPSFGLLNITGLLGFLLLVIILCFSPAHCPGYGGGKICDSGVSLGVFCIGKAGCEEDRLSSLALKRGYVLSLVVGNSVDRPHIIQLVEEVARIEQAMGGD